MCNNGFGGGNCCWIIILLIIIWCCCGNGSWGGNNCGCGCGNNCGCNPKPVLLNFQKRTDAPGRCARGVFAGTVPGPPFPCALRSAVAQFLCLQRRFPRYAARLGPVVFIPLCPRKKESRRRAPAFHPQKRAAGGAAFSHTIPRCSSRILAPRRIRIKPPAISAHL